MPKIPSGITVSQCLPGAEIPDLAAAVEAVHVEARPRKMLGFG